jgi:hypothetical protein
VLYTFIILVYMIFTNMVTILADKCVGFRTIKMTFLFYKQYMLVFFNFYFLVMDDFCYGWGGISYFVRA